MAWGVELKIRNFLAVLLLALPACRKDVDDRAYLGTYVSQGPAVAGQRQSLTLLLQANRQALLEQDFGGKAGPSQFGLWDLSPGKLSVTFFGKDKNLIPQTAERQSPVGTLNFRIEEGSQLLKSTDASGFDFKRVVNPAP